MGKTWREECRPIIAKVLEETKGQDEKVVRKALRDAYPFGERAYHPYKIWLDEIKVQTKRKRFGQKTGNNNPDQQELFK